jgi:hypothetical protein
MMTFRNQWKQQGEATMRKRPVGRPKQGLKLITIDQAVDLIKETLMAKFANEKIVEQKSYSKGSLYNLRSKGKLTAYGDIRCALVDEEEILELCG